MKAFILLSLVALCASSSLRTSKGWGKGEGVESMGKRYGFGVLVYEVQTRDGYILDLYRLFDEEKREERREPVVLIHGYLTSGEAFGYGGKTESLAFYLVNQGYDVYIANLRGSDHGRRHTQLNPMKDQKFWSFTFNEMGVNDLPAIIDKVLELTQRSKVRVVAHNEGTTAMFVTLSEKPEYNDKIEYFVSLGPIVYMANSNQEIIKKSIGNNKAWLTKNLGLNTFTPSEEVLTDIKKDCIDQKYDSMICENVYFLVNGYNSNNFNMTTITEMLMRVPGTGSVRDFLHFIQMKQSGRFEKFDENYGTKQQRTEAVEYDLSKVTVPVGIIYTPNDVMSSVTDVEMLISKLPNVLASKKIDELSNNLDLIYSTKVRDINVIVEKYLRGEKL